MLVMNLKMVNELGLIVPAPLLTRADEVSECHSRRRDCDPLPQTIHRWEADGWPCLIGRAGFGRNPFHGHDRRPRMTRPQARPLNRPYRASAISF
jgi:hypothetical protein